MIAQLLFLEAEDPERDILLYINSPGGSITAGLAIYDTMQYIRPDVSTYCLGQCASFAAVLLAAGAKGKRYALPNSRILIHQPWVQGRRRPGHRHRHPREGNPADAAPPQRDPRGHSGQPMERLQADTERDYIMSAEQAREYGIIDDVLRKRLARVSR